MQVEFGSLFHFIRNGMNVKQDKSGEGLPITRIETISDAKIDANRVGYAGLKIEDCRDWLLEKGDILFSHINSVEHIGKCAIYEQEPKSLVHGINLLCLRCDQNKLQPAFAKHLIRSSRFRRQLSSFINKAVNQASVSIGNLRTIKVSVPPISEQVRIADVLDHADTLRVKRIDALVQLDELSQATFIEIFGAPSTNPKGFPVSPLSQHILPISNWNPATKPDNEFVYVDIGAIDQSTKSIHSPQKILGQEAPSRARQLIQVGDVLVSTVRPNLNAVAEVKEHSQGMTASTGFCVLRPNNQTLNTAYLFGLVKSKKFIADMVRQATGASYPAVTDKVIHAWQAPLPPLQLQNEYAEKVALIQRERLRHEDSLKEIEALCSSLQYHAFNGSI